MRLDHEGDRRQEAGDRRKPDGCAGIQECSLTLVSDSLYWNTRLKMAKPTDDLLPPASCLLSPGANEW